MLKYERALCYIFVFTIFSVWIPDVISLATLVLQCLFRVTGFMEIG